MASAGPFMYILVKMGEFFHPHRGNMVPVPSQYRIGLPHYSYHGEPVPHRQGKVCGHNIVNGIILPFVLLGSFSGSAAWICMFIGGTPLLNSIVQWRVNFGLFALNSSMVVIIVAVFFIVRSITFFLNRALDAISLRREEIQMGTVKSIQAILSHIVWCLYIFFSLNLLGLSLNISPLLPADFLSE